MAPGKTQGPVQPAARHAAPLPSRETTRPFLRQGGHSDKLLNVPVTRVRENPNQPRRHFEPEALAVLARSIDQEGLLQPVSVRPLPEDPDTYLLVAGERRLQAVRDILNWTSIPARIYWGSNPAGAALAENLVRADLNLVEKAEALERYRLEAPNAPLSNRQIQDELGISLAQISRLTKVTQLPEVIKVPIREGRVALPMLRLEALAEIRDPQAQLAAFQAAIECGGESEGDETTVRSALTGSEGPVGVRRPARRSWDAGPYFERTMTNARRLSMRLQRIGPYGAEDLGSGDIGEDLRALEDLRSQIDRFLSRHGRS